ncbi:redoxin domain-containing protein [bacterium]|nr:redoxin domain-containing protein [bacterium]
MKRYMWLSFLMIISAMVIISCSINESEEPDEGFLYVAARDTVDGVDIVGADVFIDGQQHSQTTPTLISNLSVGQHIVRIRPSAGYPSQSDTAEVFAFDTTRVEMPFAAQDTSILNNQTLLIESTPAGAQINIDDRKLEDIITPARILLTPDDQNAYSVSVYLPGNKTLAPYLYEVFAEAGDTTTLTFELEPHATSNTIGGLVPDFKLANYQVPADWSDSVSVGEYRGKVVMVNFWFANCVPCREEFPSIQQTYIDRYEEGFRVIALNTGWYPDDAEDFLEFREDFGLTFPLLFNSIGADLYNENGYEVQGAPTNILVDRSGVIRDRFGATNHDDLNTRINAVMELTAP